MSLNSKMGRVHEEFLVKILGGRKTKASGSQWTDQMDGRHARHLQEFAFAWDGKAVGVDTRVLTPSGYVRMGDVQVGDPVLNTYGGTSRVTGVFPQGERRMFRLEFSDGTGATASDDHLWTVFERTVKTITDSAGRRQESTLMERLWTTEKIRSRPNLMRIHLPEHQAVAFDGCLPEGALDPYALGALLGDGHISDGSVVLTSADEHVVERTRSGLPDGLSMVKYADRGTCASYRIKGRDTQGRFMADILRDSEVIRALGWHKAIPSVYLHTSIEDRWALLQGLLDTDGWVEKGGGRFASASAVLSDQVAWLARSLGLRASTRTVETPRYTYQGEVRVGRLSHQVVIRSHPNLFSLPRQVEKLREPQRRTMRRSIVAVTEVEAAQAQCIRVDADDSLFFIEDFVPTHNSTRAKSIGVTRAMWEKAKEQAGGERPLLPLRFYDTDKLDVGLDLVVLSLDDFAEMLERVNDH